MARIIASRLSRGPQVTPCSRTCRITASGNVIEALAPERTPISAIVPPGRTRRSEASSVSAPPVPCVRTTEPGLTAPCSTTAVHAVSAAQGNVAAVSVETDGGRGASAELGDRYRVAQNAVAWPAERAREFRHIGLTRDPAGKEGNHDPVAGPHPRASRPDRFDCSGTVRAGDDRQVLAGVVDAVDQEEIAPVQADSFDGAPALPRRPAPGARAPRRAGCRCRSRRSAPKPGQSCLSLHCALRLPPPADAMLGREHSPAPGRGR